MIHLIRLLLFIIFTTSNYAYAQEISDKTYQEMKPEVGTQSDTSSITKPLNLTINHEVINEPKEQQNTVIKKSKPLLPNIFKDQTEKDVSMDSGVLINDETTNSEIIDGAEISIKVKTK